MATGDQPHLPSELGFYELRVPKVMDVQAALAKEYGVYGFCYYHYWFNGNLVLERPLHQMLESNSPQMPFCLCWANENWTRRWDGGDTSILLKQDYAEQDDLRHIRYLLSFFKDPRYIKIDGRPLFLMYRPELHPRIKEAVNIWREETVRAGFPGLYLAAVENFTSHVDPSRYEFDAGVEFAPQLRSFAKNLKKVSKKNRAAHLLRKILHRSKICRSAHFDHSIYSLRDVAELMRSGPNPPYPRFRCVTPSWDNSARRKKGAHIFVDSHPSLLEEWTRDMAEYTRRNLPDSHQFLFVNAWNEWAEGCHLEPCQRYGRAWLEALKRGLTHLP